MSQSKRMKQALWDQFCSRFEANKRCVPLFELDDAGHVAVQVKRVKSRKTGAYKEKHYLVRSTHCENLIVSIAQKLVEDWNSGQKRLDGMIYVMGWRKAGKLVPLYIGKTESKGRNGAPEISANLQRLATSKGKFARWGDGYQYHIGDLSASLLPGHDEDTKKVSKYESWADCLFANRTTKLRQPVYFWATEWDRSQIGIWEEFGSTSLSFLEYLLIGVAGDISPELLNREGISRSARNSGNG